MKRSFFFLSALIVGVLLGYFYFKSAVGDALGEKGITNGPWETNTAYGESYADPILKSAVAMRGLMALKISETVYYSAFNDNDGQRLSELCTYKISGVPLDSRWWSITVYGSDHFLIPNVQDKYSFFMPQEVADFEFYVAREEPSSDHVWLPTKGGGELSITLRLYNPERSVYENLNSVELPMISNEGCSS